MWNRPLDYRLDIPKNENGQCQKWEVGYSISEIEDAPMT